MSTTNTSSTTTTTGTTPTPQYGGSSISGHLGTSWEVAVAILIIAVACAVIGTVVWQTRRQRRRQRRRELFAAEEGSRKGESPPDEFDKVSEPLPKLSYTVFPYRHSKTLSSISSASSTLSDHRTTQAQKH